MKKLTATILALLFILSSVTAVAAEGKAHRMNEANCEHESECSHPMDGDHDAHIEEAESAAAFADNGIQSEKAPGAEPDTYHTAPNAGSIKRASGESRRLARTAVEKLIEEPVDFTGLVQSNLNGREERIYHNICSVAPEVAVLEKRADGALALLELYEEFSADSAYYDWQGLKQRRNRQNTDSNYQWRYADAEGFGMWQTPRIIEGLFAKVFYKKLDKAQQTRFLQALCEVYNTVTAVVRNHDEKSISHSYFFMCGGSALIDEYKFDVEKARVVVKGLPEVDDGNLLEYESAGNVLTTGMIPIAALKAKNELSSELKGEIRAEMESLFPNIQFVASATSMYNCHSYAWYLPSTSNNRWINNDDILIANVVDDYHCVALTSQQSPQVGDIIVYEYRQWAGCTAAYDPWAHSGIVISTNPIRVRSKWGACCVWIHSKDDVLREYKYNNSTKVRYYRYSRTHNYQYSQYTSNKHKASCPCGKTFYEKHEFLNSNTCQLCGYYTPVLPYNWENPALPSGKFELDLCSSGDSAA